jgi:hypothetical protein
MEKNQQGIWGKIKNKISNFLNPKPKTFLLGNGEPLEIDGKIPSSGIVGFFNNIAGTIIRINFEFQKLEPSDLEIKDISVQNIKIYFGIEATEQEEEKYEVLSLNTENIDINKNYMINGSLAKALLEFI